MRGKKWLLGMAVGLTMWLPLRGQDVPPDRLTFEVASIHRSQPGLSTGGIKPLPNGHGYIAQNVSVRLMLSLMYRVPARQIQGGPEWLDTERYDIEAKADHAYGHDDLHAMFRNLLADRMGLKLRRETREGAVYALLVDKSGPKMKVDDGAEDFSIPVTSSQAGVAVGTRVPMRYFCWWLGLQLRTDERPVIDKTGLDKNYDFNLTFAPVLPPGANIPEEVMDRPSLFDALKQQLGLKLQAEKGPVDYYIVDHVEKPSAN